MTITFKSVYSGSAQGWFKIYLPATTNTTVRNVSNGIKLTWDPVEGAEGYVIYRRAKKSTSTEWTAFDRWNNTTALTWTDTNVYGATGYQYGVKAYFAERVDPVSGATIGGAVDDNYNLGMVGPIVTMVRISTRTLTSVTAGSKSFTASWSDATAFTGYQIQYATSSTFSGAVTVKITNQETTTKTISSLTSGTKYYIRVRSYCEFDGVNYYGAWSNVLDCTVN